MTINAKAIKDHSYMCMSNMSTIFDDESTVDFVKRRPLEFYMAVLDEYTFTPDGPPEFRACMEFLWELRDKSTANDGKRWCKIEMTDEEAISIIKDKVIPGLRAVRDFEDYFLAFTREFKELCISIYKRVYATDLEIKALRKDVVDILAKLSKIEDTLARFNTAQTEKKTAIEASGDVSDVKSSMDDERIRRIRRNLVPFKPNLG